MELSYLRQNFAPAEFDQKICESCQAMLNHITETNEPVLRGYKAAFQMISANFLTSPLSKLNAFMAGKNQIERTIAQTPQNLELRYIRLALQMRSPVFLGYKSNIDIDKRFIAKYLPNETDKDLITLILGFVNTQQGIEPSYRTQIQSIVSSLV